MWRIRLFGTLEVESPSGVIVRFTGTKAGGILAYLALNLDKPVKRETLANLFWANSDVASQRTRVRQETLALRALFGEDDASPLRTAPQTISFSSENVVTDAAQFATLLNNANKSKDSAEKESILSEALALYRGDLLNDYLEIALPERAAYSQGFESALRELAALRQARGDFAGAEESLQRLVSYNPLIEEAHVDLMRLYSACGQPTKLRRQYAFLEETLRKEVASVPLESTRLLVEELLLSAAPNSVRFAPSSDGLGEALFAVPEEGGEALWAEPVASLPQKRALPLWARGVACMLIAFAALSLFNRKSQPHVVSKPVVAPPLQYGAEKWKFVYTLQAGEKGDAEPRAVTTNRLWGHIYVAGLVQTDKDDADILALKLSNKGELMRHARYSSPEHDCDRAFSITQEIKEENTVAVYVAGETFVPASPGVKEGWRLVLIKYDENLKQQWVRRSSAIVHNELHNIRVVYCEDGITIGGTAFEHGDHQILLLRYSRKGDLLWQRSFKPPNAISSAFSDMAADERGNIYVCGTALQEMNERGSHTEWTTLCYDVNGALLWSHNNSGSGRGGDAARRIALSSTEGFVYVFGEFYNGNPSEGGFGTNIALAQYTLDGIPRWTRFDPRSGPEISATSMALNSYPKTITLGGTKPAADRSSALFLSQYDKDGNLRWNWQYAPPREFKSAATPYLATTDRDEVVALASLSTLPAANQHEHNQYLLAQLSSSGALKAQRSFKALGDMHTPRGCYADNHDGSLLVFGQAQQADKKMAFVVLKY